MAREFSFVWNRESSRYSLHSVGKHSRFEAILITSCTLNCYDLVPTPCVHNIEMLLGSVNISLKKQIKRWKSHVKLLVPLAFLGTLARE